MSLHSEQHIISPTEFHRTDLNRILFPRSRYWPSLMNTMMNMWKMMTNQDQVILPLRIDLHHQPAIRWLHWPNSCYSLLFVFFVFYIEQDMIDFSGPRQALVFSLLSSLFLFQTFVRSFTLMITISCCFVYFFLVHRCCCCCCTLENESTR